MYPKLYFCCGFHGLIKNTGKFSWVVENCYFSNLFQSCNILIITQT